MCKHENFQAVVKVCRLVDEKGESQVNAFVAEINVVCMECMLPFEWVGLPVGYSGVQPMTSLDATELRAPLKPVGVEKMPGIPSYSVQFRSMSGSKSN